MLFRSLKLAMRTVELETAGLSVRVDECGGGPPLLYLSPEHFIPANDAFVERLGESFRVVVPRYPGFDGTAPAGDFRRVEDLTYLLMDVVEQLSLDDVHVVGSSLGGWLGLELAVRQSSWMRTMSLVSPLGVKFGDRETRGYADLNALPKPELEAALFAQRDGAPSFADMDDATLEQFGLERQYLAYYAWNPYLHNPSLRRWLHRVRIPVQLLWGTEDGYNRPDNAQPLANALPDASVTWLEHVGHYPQLEAPERLLDPILSFIRAHDGRPA